MIVEANTEEEKGKVKIFFSFLNIHPMHETGQNSHERKDTQGVDFHNDHGST